MDKAPIIRYLEKTSSVIDNYIGNSEVPNLCKPSHIHDSVTSYLRRPAKRLRPAILILASCCLGGEKMERASLPAAVGIELFHTWTLVHDDIIDNDDLRRGEKTVHVEMRDRALKEFKLDRNLSEEYGRSIAILTGDMLHGWAISAFVECYQQSDIDPAIVLKLIHHLQTEVISKLVYGEVLDVQYSLLQKDTKGNLTDNDILNMEYLKTGVLYEFSALAGALIGKNTNDFSDPQANALSEFASFCGIAFQLQDDILGIVGDEKALGKPIGSDMREGKQTTIVLEALRKANEGQRRVLTSVLGNHDASHGEINSAIALLKDLGGIEYTQKLAEQQVKKGLPFLEAIPDSSYKDTLYSWADFMINRKY